MNAFDFLLLLPLVYFCYKGILKGFVRRVFAILGYVLGVAVSYLYHGQVAELITVYWQNPSVEYLAYILPFLGVVIVAKLVAIVLTKGLKLAALSPLNIFLGALFGLLQGALFSTLIALVFLVMNNTFDTPLKSLTQDSFIIQHSEDCLKSILDQLAISV